MRRDHRIALLFVVTALTVGWARGPGARPEPTGAMVWAWHVIIAPSWFDPAERRPADHSSKGAYAYGAYPDLDALYQRQARERDSAKREALLHRIQQLTVERMMFAPIAALRALMGVGFRVAEHGINLIPLVV